MKKSYKHKTGWFGTDSEHYASRLFKMLKNPNGSRRPDLITIANDLGPRLSIELKSGQKQKGILVDYQLHYAITGMDDYVELFDQKPQLKEEFFPEMREIAWALSRQGNVAYYYGFLNRVDKVTSADLDRPFSTIKLRWGDCWIVPHEFGFYGFAISQHMRTGTPVKKIVGELWEIIKDDVNNENHDYDKRKGHEQSWQDIHSRDIEAIFQDDLDIATRDGKKRIGLFWKHYSKLGSLSKIVIPGPGKTNLYVLTEPEHEELFDKQFRGVIEERAPIIEKVARQRKRALSLLDKIKPSSDSYLFDEEVPKGKEFVLNELSRRQIKKLKRLIQWRDEGEGPWSWLPEKPDDDIPF